MLILGIRKEGLKVEKRNLKVKGRKKKNEVSHPVTTPIVYLS